MGKNTLKLGDWNALCDRCGFKYKASQLKETWDNLRVCKKCWEPRHPQDLLRGVPDDPSVPWTRPDPDGAGGTDINGDTFPPTFLDTTEAIPEGTFDNNLESIMYYNTSATIVFSDTGLDNTEYHVWKNELTEIGGFPITQINVSVFNSGTVGDTIVIKRIGPLTGLTFNVFLLGTPLAVRDETGNLFELTIRYNGDGWDVISYELL